MYRPRLRTKTGCLNCRKRRKKCDDQRPRCSQCLRLKLSCEWDGNPTSTLRKQSSPDLESQSILETATSDTTTTNISPSMQRIADHDGLDRRATKSPSGIIEDMASYYEMPSESCAPVEMGEMRHILIVGIFKGWDHVPRTICSQELWANVILLDNLLQLTGQGKVARLAMGLLSLALIQHMANPNRRPEERIMNLPAWYLPDQPGPKRASNSVFWPAVRHRVSGGPPRYANDRFAYCLLSEGIRFIWPYQPIAAVIFSKTTARFCLADEFVLRVNNIRSMAMPVDFMERYPEFQGEAPQLEPSPMFYTPKDVDNLERLYWRRLRERPRSGETELWTPYCQEFTFSPDDTNTMVASRSALAIPNLLNPIGTPIDA